MIDDMPRPRPPHLHSEFTRHGARVWYVRIGHGPRIRIRAAFGTPEFHEQYRAAIAGEAPAPKRGPANGTLEWLIARYRDSGAWAAFSPATRRQRENIFHHIIASAGTVPYREIDRKTIIAGRERRLSPQSGGEVMSNGQIIIDGLNDALAWTKGDETACHAVHARVKRTEEPAMPPIPEDIMHAAMEAYLSLMDDDRYDDHKYGSEHIASAIMAERERAAAEIAELKSEVMAFCAPHAVHYARQCGLPDSHIHSVHYDILEKCGARMVGFKRHDPAAAIRKGDAL